MRVLLVEDEKKLSAAVANVLTGEHYVVDAVYTGTEGLDQAETGIYDAIILDVMLPGMDGFEILRTLREDKIRTPVLMLTARGSLEDRVRGLESGADYYLPKPFQMAELLARLRSLTRRAGNYTPKSMRVGNVILDVEQQELRCESSIRLAKKEARLMEYFMANPDKEFTEAELLGHVWKDEEVDGTVVWVYISYLKSKLNAVAADQTIEGETGGPFRLATVKPKEG